MQTNKLLTWFGVVVVLLVCFVASCVLAMFSLSEAGRDQTGDWWRNAGNIGRDDEETPPVNESYELSFDEDGAVHFFGRGLQLTLPPGCRVKQIEERPEDALFFEYFLESADGLTQVRLRREENQPYFWYGGDRERLFNHVKGYAENIAGPGPVEAVPLAYVATSSLAASMADVGIEGCYRYTAEARGREGYDGEYFIFVGRGYNNVVLLSVASKPFNRDTALVKGRAFAATLSFN